MTESSSSKAGGAQGAKDERAELRYLWRNILSRMLLLYFVPLLLIAVFFLPPMEIGLAMLMAVLMGFSYSAAHMLPDAIFPDVIDWDELQPGERHERVVADLRVAKAYFDDHAVIVATERAG